MRHTTRYGGGRNAPIAGWFIAPTDSVMLSGSTWPATARQLLDPVYGIGNAMPLSSCQQFDTLLWSIVNQVSIAFSEDMIVAAQDLSLLGVAIPQYTLAGGGFAYDAVGQ